MILLPSNLTNAWYWFPCKFGWTTTFQIDRIDLSPILVSSMENQTGRLINMSHFLQSSKAPTNTKLTFIKYKVDQPSFLNFHGFQAIEWPDTNGHWPTFVEINPIFNSVPRSPFTLHQNLKSTQFLTEEADQLQTSKFKSSNLSWKSICQHLTDLLHFEIFEVFLYLHTFDHLSQQCYFQKFIFVIFQA